MHDFFVYLYIVSFGFVAAGICTSGARMITGRSLGFAVDPAAGQITAILGVFVRVFAGPAILMRNSVRGAMIERRPAYWLALSTMIATLWSFFSGVVIVETIFGFGGGL
ncbi:hypothetical protein MnTg02_01572 [bacterium MnTg02]|nr:hypothetical protein MnTg02_01572 [bacterium MnTg02]